MWAFTKSDEYSVKSAYFLGKSCDLRIYHQAWLELWNLNVTPKVRHFLWRVCTGTLAVRDYLKYRHMSDNAGYAWCVGTSETFRHYLFDCPTIRDLCVELDCEDMMWKEEESFLEVIVSWKSVDDKTRQRGAVLLLYIWGRRNDKIFNAKEVPFLSLWSARRDLLKILTHTQPKSMVLCANSLVKAQRSG